MSAVDAAQWGLIALAAIGCLIGVTLLLSLRYSHSKGDATISAGPFRVTTHSPGVACLAFSAACLVAATGWNATGGEPPRVAAAVTAPSEGARPQTSTPPPTHADDRSAVTAQSSAGAERVEPEPSGVELRDDRTGLRLFHPPDWTRVPSDEDAVIAALDSPDATARLWIFRVDDHTSSGTPEELAEFIQAQTPAAGIALEWQPLAIGGRAGRYGSFSDSRVTANGFEPIAGFFASLKPSDDLGIVYFFSNVGDSAVDAFRWQDAAVGVVRSSTF